MNVIFSLIISSILTAKCVLQTAVQALNSRGILVIASAGNDGLNSDTIPHVPSTLAVSNVVSVAALEKPTLVGAAASAPTLWSGSNVGKRTVTLAAPGVQVSCQKRV